MIIFDTARLRVRTLTTADAAGFFHIQGDADVMRYIREPKSRAESDQYLTENIRESETLHPLGRWAVESKATGALIGSFVLVPVDHDHGRNQLGYALLKAYWGQGLATELTMAGIAYLKDNTVLTEIHAYVEEENQASVQVLLKSGFQLVGDKLLQGKKLLIFHLPLRDQ